MLGVGIMTTNSDGGASTAPLVPADCDLRDFQFMPVDIVRLFGSRFHAISSDAEWRAGVTLWLKSFHQVPAASLPDDDIELCRLAELGRDVKAWRKLRANALHGWVLCSDGRLYHPVVAEKASEAWRSKLARMGRVIRRLQVESGEWAAIRSSVYARDDYTCRYCGSRGVELECDHVVPVSKGGATTLENLVTACRPCNRSKGAKSLSEWRPEWRPELGGAQ